jgi:hypothetical protein
MTSYVPGRTARTALLTLLALALTAWLAAGPASAAPQNDLEIVPVASDPVKIADFDIFGPIIGDPTTAHVNITVKAYATYSANLTTLLSWDDNKVRQGAALDVTRAPFLQSGDISVEWDLDGIVSPYNGAFGSFDVGTKIVTKDVQCDPQLSGGTYTCQVDAEGAKLWPSLALQPYAKLYLHAQFEITPTGAILTRNLAIGGTNVAGPGSLPLGPSSQTDTLPVPCSAQAGDPVDYQLGPYHWTPSVQAHEWASIIFGMMDITGLVELPAFPFGIAFGDQIDSTPNFDLTGDGFTTPLGTLKQNGISPTIDPLGPFSGNEGSQIGFGANVASPCSIASEVWDFSDGTKSYGPSPKRAFADNGDYSGQLTVTDDSGKSSTRSFTVSVADLPPVANAGPDTTANWGRPVAFNGQATDPGSADQPTLQYTWAFGDGTPSASGGPSTIHAYSQPGTYTAALKVCDKDGMCDIDTRDVVVTKRDTQLAYLGDTSGTYDTPATLQGYLVDEYGNPIAGRTLTFFVAADGPYTALTASTGIATRSYTSLLAAAPYPLSTSFAGDALYNASTAQSSFTVAKNATSIVYTGDKSGSTNKTVALSATLKDASGKPLAGKAVVFQLASQTINAVTDANGVASATSAKLTEKKGTFSVSASYAGDSHYLPAVQSTPFTVK